MRTLAQLKERIKPYAGLEYVYLERVGYLVWHETTGDNLEFLFLEVREKGQGHGKALYTRMAERLIGQGREPYHSVIGWRLGSNKDAERFYEKLGFTQVNMGRSVYRDDDAVFMWQPWASLKKVLGLA